MLNISFLSHISQNLEKTELQLKETTTTTTTTTTSHSKERMRERTAKLRLITMETVPSSEKEEKEKGNQEYVSFSNHVLSIVFSRFQWVLSLETSLAFSE